MTRAGHAPHQSIRDGLQLTRSPAILTRMARPALQISKLTPAERLRLLDVLALEIGVARENLVEGGAMRDLTNDDRDRNPHPANAGAAAEGLDPPTAIGERSPLLARESAADRAR